MKTQMENKDVNNRLLQGKLTCFDGDLMTDNKSARSKMYEVFIKKKCKDPPEHFCNHFRYNSMVGLIDSNEKINKEFNNNNTLKFTIMKKQILFLSIFVWLALCNQTIVFGQNTTAKPGSTPRPLVGCTDDALHPLPGKEYTYQSTATPGGGVYTWWATLDPNFITTSGTTTTNNLSSMLTAGNGILNPSSNYGIAGADDNVKLTWSSTLLSTTKYNTAPTFVVVHYKDAASCTDNLKVYQLDPINGFTVDIRNIDATVATPAIKDYGEEASQCNAPVTTAKFNGTTMEYEYGTNYLYYEVVAANFTGTWTPTFVVNGLNAVQTSTVEWSYDPPSGWSGTTWHAASDPVTTTETNTSGGVSIYVRVTVVNNNYEGIADLPVALAVSGVDATGALDLNNADCSKPADAAAAQADDEAIQNLTKRPTLPSTTTGAPAPNVSLIPGNEQN